MSISLRLQDWVSIKFHMRKEEIRSNGRVVPWSQGCASEESFTKLYKIHATLYPQKMLIYTPGNSIHSTHPYALCDCIPPDFAWLTLGQGEMPRREWTMESTSWEILTHWSWRVSEFLSVLFYTFLEFQACSEGRASKDCIKRAYLKGSCRFNVQVHRLDTWEKGLIFHLMN